MVRSYQDSDYAQLKELYLKSEWYGGVFDEARDGQQRLAQKIVNDPQAILVYEENSELVGSVSLIDDGRVAWLYRFTVKDYDSNVTKKLYDSATSIFKSRGHTQVLVYSDMDSHQLAKRYEALGMKRGDNYTCFWTAI